MVVQKQVCTGMRTQTEIDTERQGTITVYPTATKTATECFPCIAVEVIREGQRPQRTWEDLRKLGRNYESLDAALNAAKKVRVISVDEAGCWRALKFDQPGH